MDESENKNDREQSCSVLQQCDEEAIKENVSSTSSETDDENDVMETDEKTAVNTQEPSKTIETNESKSTEIVANSDDLSTSSSVTPPPSNDDKQLDTDQQNTDKIRSRELKSLIAAAKESNLDTNIVHKRKSIAEQLTVRRNSIDPDSDKSISTTPSSAKRIMRSQNPDFVSKHLKFISKVTNDSDLKDAIHNEDELPPVKKDAGTLKRKRDSISTSSPMEDKKHRKIMKSENICPRKPGKDTFCWQCHKEGVQIQCVACPRSFHLRCLRHAMPVCENWTCSECNMIMQAEHPETQSYARRRLNDEKFTQVLKFALKRMISITGSEPFMNPVNTNELNDYTNYVIHPMDLNQLRNNIEKNIYKSTEAFIADAKWILHNSMVYNSSQSKLTSVAKSIVKTGKIEMAEIETCPECYINANTHKDTWFIEVCSKPHILVWAKLKGFPFWPAKAVNTNDSGMVDVRFFGAHDKAWVPVKDVYLYSEKDPNTINKHQKNNIAESLKEVELHIEKLIQRFGEFVPAPLRTAFEPENERAQLKLLLPNFQISQTDFNEMGSKNLFYKRNKKLVIKKIIKDDNRKNSKNGNDSVDYDEEGGYGTEEEDSPTSSESRKKFKKIMNASTDEDKESDKSDSENSQDDKKVKTLMNASVRSVKVRSRGGYPNVTEKIRVISSGDNLKLGVINNSFKIELFDKPDSKSSLQRRDSDVSSKSSKSDVSRVSDKINRVEFSEMTEVKLGVNKDDYHQQQQQQQQRSGQDEILTKLKPVIQVNPVELINTNTEIRISPQSKTPMIQTMADKIMLKINENNTGVKKQLDNLLDKSLPPADSSKTVKKSADGKNKKDNSTNNATPSSSSSSYSARRNSSINTDSDYEPDTDSEDDEDSDVENSRTIKNKQKPTTNVTLVDVKRIIMGSNENENTKPESDKKNDDTKTKESNKKEIVAKPTEKLVKKDVPKEKTVTSTQKKETIPLDPNIDIKEEVLDSDDEHLLNSEPSKHEFFPALNLSPNVTLSVIEKQQMLNKRKIADERLKTRTATADEKKKSTKIMDSVTKTIEQVAKSAVTTNSSPPNKKTELKVISVAEINQKKLERSSNVSSSQVTNKQKARKSFPNKSTTNNNFQTTSINNTSTTNKKHVKERPTYSTKIDSINPANKAQQDLAIKTFENAKDKMVYIPHPQTTGGTAAVTILPPSIAFNSVPSTAKFLVPQTLLTGLTSQASSCTATKLITAPIMSSVCGLSTTPATVSQVARSPHQLPTDDERNDMLPPLKPRPTGPLHHDNLDSTSTNLGHVNQLLTKSSHQMADYFRSIILETLSDVANMGNLEGRVKELQLEIENQKQKHQEEISALKFEIANLKQAQISEKQKIIQETKQACEQERIRSIEEAKSKQWCAMCLKESQYRCCWSTSYCSYTCQRNHWPQHQTKCQQGAERTNSSSNNSIEITSIENDSNSPATVIKPVKNTYSANKNKPQSKNIMNQKTTPGKFNFISTTKPSGIPSSSVPTLTFVQNSSGGIELVNHHGPIALGGKLIPSSKMIKGYFVSSTLNPNPAPVINSIGGKNLIPIQPAPSLTGNATNSIIGSPTSSSSIINSTNKSSAHVSSSNDEHNEIMERDSESL